MTGVDAARTWSAIFSVLYTEFNKETWTWDIERLEDITTELTVAIIKARK